MVESGAVLIAGMGDVGTLVASSLIKAGRMVCGIRRQRREPWPDGVEALLLDLASPEAVKAIAAHRFSDVIFCAAAGHSSEISYHDTYVLGLKHVLTAVQGPHLRRVLFTSSTGVYAQDDGSWVDENSPTDPAHYSGSKMLEAERALTMSGVPAVILRLGGIYGQGRATLVERVREGRESLSAGSTRYMNLIHREDAAGAIIHLLNLAAPESVYIGVDGVAPGRNEVILWLAEQLRVPPPKLVEGVATPSFRANKRCSGARLRASGYSSKYPDFRDGYGPLAVAASSRY